MIEKEDKASKKRANKSALLTLYWVSWEHPTLALKVLISILLTPVLIILLQILLKYSNHKPKY